MGFVVKTWNNPINLDANNLNRIEQGIKSSHDTLDIIEDEVSSLQTKHLELKQELENLVKDSPDILETLNRINSLLEDGSIETTLNNADKLLLKTAQTLTIDELEQVYNNLKLNSFLKLTDIKVNNNSVVKGSVVNITLPKIDNELNINSTNAISNKAVAEVLKNFNSSVAVPDELADLKQDAEHQTVSAAEKLKWNSINSTPVEFTETDPTVPSWAKEPVKPFYSYNEILNTPDIPTDTKDLTNGAGYIVSSEAEEIVDNSLKEYTSSTITPINNKIISLESTDTTIINSLNNKAPLDHTHNYAEVDHTHDYSSLYALINHTHDEYKTYTDEQIAALIDSAPDTLNTLKELATEITNNKTILDTLNSAIGNKAEKDHNHAGVYASSEHYHDGYVDMELESLTDDNITTWKTKLGISSLPLGAIFASALPVSDSKVHLLDGSTISQTGIYSQFVSKLKSLVSAGYNLTCTQSEFDSYVSLTGNCGKFVIDDTAGIVRLPKITKFIQGLSSITDIGKSFEAGLPNIVGHFSLKNVANSGHGAAVEVDQTDGLFTDDRTLLAPNIYSDYDSVWGDGYDGIKFDASQANNTYGNSDTVQPAATQFPYYMVLANGYSSNIEVEMDSIMSEVELIRNMASTIYTGTSSTRENNNIISNITIGHYNYSLYIWTS